jgi:O-antigen/teichoic acid export membrane protein
VTVARSVRRNVVWSITGNVVYSLSLWGILVLLARRDQTGQLAGQLSLAYAVCLPVQMFFNLQLRSVQATDARRRFRFSDYFRVRLLSLPLTLLVVGAVLALGPYSGETGRVILAIALIKSIDAISDCFQGLFQQHERLDLVARSMIARGSLGLAGMAAGVALGGSLLAGIAVMGGGSALSVVAVDWPMARRILRADQQSLLGGAAGSALLRPLIWTALPLGVWALAGSLIQFIPQFAVERFLGQQQLGVFMTIYSLLVALSTLLAAIGEAVTPRLAVRIAENDRQGFLALNMRFVGLVALLSMAMVAGIALFGRWFLATVYGPAYALHAGTFFWLSVAAAVSLVAGALSSNMMAAWRFRPLLITMVAVAVSSAVLHGIFVPRHGLFGTVYALAGLALLMTVMYLATFMSILRGLSRPRTT